MTTTVYPWQTALPALYHRAATDPEFRALCLRDARAALLEMGHVEVPENLPVRFAEKVDEIVLPLPAEPIAMEDLDAVAGGAVNVGTSYVNRGEIFVPYGYPTYPGSVWPPVDPNTASGLPPLVPPGGPPPGY